MTDFYDNMEFDSFFRFKFQSAVLFIVILLLGNKTCRGAPVINSTSELLNSTDTWYLILKDEFPQGNTTLTNQSDEFVLDTKQDEDAGSVFVAGVNLIDDEFIEDQNIIQKFSNDAVTESPNMTSESTMSKSALSTNDFGEMEHSTIGQSVVENAVSPFDLIGSEIEELQSQVRQNSSIDNSNSVQKATTAAGARSFSDTTSGLSPSGTPQSVSFHENSENSTFYLKTTGVRIPQFSDIHGQETDVVENTSNEEFGTGMDDSISKTGLTIDWNVSSAYNSLESFSTANVSSIFKNLQSTHSSQPENIRNNENESDEYVDQLHQAMISYGLPDSLSEEDDIVVVPDEPLEDLTFGGTLIPSSEGVSRDMALSTESVGNLKDALGVDTTVKIYKETKDEVDTTIKTQRRGHLDEADQSRIPNDEQWPKDEPARDIIELPNGVVIDALFDNIESLQDQLDICEEGLRQRLVVHKDIFFMNSHSLMETDENVELPAGDLTEEDHFPPIISEASPNQPSLAKGTMVEAQENNPTTLTPSYTTDATTNDAWNNEENKGDEDTHYVTFDDKSGINYYHTLDTKTTDIENNDGNDNNYFMTNSVSFQENTGLVNDKDKAHNDIVQVSKQDKGGIVEDSNHVMNKGQSYYANVARTVIKRLSKRLRYLEVSVEECNHLIQSMTRHKTPP